MSNHYKKKLSCQIMVSIRKLGQYIWGGMSGSGMRLGQYVEKRLDRNFMDNTGLRDSSVREAANSTGSLGNHYSFLMQGILQVGFRAIEKGIIMVGLVKCLKVIIETIVTMLMGVNSCVLMGIKAC